MTGPKPDADPAAGAPPRWWTEAEVRAALGRRAVLDSIETVDGPEWRAHYVLDRGAELTGSVRADRRETARTLADQRPPPARAPEPDPVLSTEDAAGFRTTRLMLHAQGQLRLIELRLAVVEADTEPIASIAVALLRLYHCLWR